MTVRLEPITGADRDVCCALRVGEAQQAYIAPNAASLAEADKPENAAIARPFGVYAGAKMVGFAMFAFDESVEPEEGRYWLWRFMIDRRYQGLGYGRQALAAIVDYFRQNGADSVTLSTKPSNTAALSLYRSVGFRETGDRNGREIVLRLDLDPLP